MLQCRAGAPRLVLFGFDFICTSPLHPAACVHLMIPGVGIAAWMGLGRTRLDRWIHGACVGLALSVWLAALPSHVDLNWFYPLWAVVALTAAAGLLQAPKLRAGPMHTALLCVLLLVAASRGADRGVQLRGAVPVV